MSRQEQIIERLTALLNDKGCPPLVLQEACEIVEEAFDYPAAVHYTPSILTYGGGWINLTICKQCGATGNATESHPTNPCGNCGHKEYNGFREVSGKWVKTGGLFYGTGYWELQAELS
jgi:hypothetical protein